MLTHRLGCVLHDLGAVPGLLDVLLHPVPEGTEGGASITVLDVAPNEATHDVAGAFAFLPRQILEVASGVIGLGVSANLVEKCREGALPQFHSRSGIASFSASLSFGSFS